MSPDDLPEVLAIEYGLYPFPWTRGNFLDSLASNYETWIARDMSRRVAGYFLMMTVVDEMHLLNITVRRDLQHQGVGRLLLNKALGLAREKKLGSILLEVRPSNLRAIEIYRQYGFSQIGIRKSYYPAADNAREDAIVMRMPA
jgi:ribosomal-protein-alanine N-acetyltransferase